MIKDEDGNIYAFDRDKLLAQMERIESMTPEEQTSLEVEFIERLYTVNGKHIKLREHQIQFIKDSIIKQRNEKIQN